MSKRVVLTGMRTTGKLHLGHYCGALQLWKEVQDYETHDCFFLLADVQALTTHASDPKVLAQSIKDVVLDWLSVGLDPTLPNVHFVLQSQVVERHGLSVLLSMIAKYNEVLRNPTLKDELKQREKPGSKKLNHSRDSVSLGFMCYPVDQAADIYMVSPTPPANGDELLVPVGEDQVPHLEYARTLATRFNTKYGRVFVPCRAMVGRVGRLVGTDGQAKMSKSLGNAIDLSDDTATVRKKVMGMFTDPNRTSSTVPGETEKNPVFVYHRAFNPNVAQVAELTERYQKGKVGDVEVKAALFKVIEDLLAPIRERRAKFESQDIREYVEAGTNVARESCKEVLAAMMDKMYLAYPK